MCERNLTLPWSIYDCTIAKHPAQTPRTECVSWTGTAPKWTGSRYLLRYSWLLCCRSLPYSYRHLCHHWLLGSSSNLLQVCYWLGSKRHALQRPYLEGRDRCRFWVFSCLAVSEYVLMVIGWCFRQVCCCGGMMCCGYFLVFRLWRFCNMKKYKIILLKMHYNILMSIIV